MGAGPAAQIGVVINGHREGLLLQASLACLQRASAYAAERNLSVDVHLVLDRPDEPTLAVADSFRRVLKSFAIVDFGNLGESRQAGLQQAPNEWIAFLDGDDLVSINWLHDAYAWAKQSDRPFDTVFHTELFIGFGAEVFFRRALRTRDPEFDPLCLIADWFFCNNLFAHNSIFKRYPIEPYDHANGLGAEDWHWSCQTTSEGVARDFVPETAYFYRIKPPGESLGMTPGLIHKSSRLFNRAYIEGTAGDCLGENAPEPMMSAANPKTPRLRRPAPSWVGEHALALAPIESLLVEVARVMIREPQRAVTFPPRMSYGAAAFYRHTAVRLSHEKKNIAVFWGKNDSLSGGLFLPSLVRALLEHFRDHTIAIFCELGGLACAALESAFADADVVLFDYAKARGEFEIPAHYLSLVTTRYFLQFDFDAIVACGSSAFDEACAVYDRAIAHRTPRLIELAPFLTFDQASPLQDAFLHAQLTRGRFENNLVCLSQGVAEAVQRQSLGMVNPVFDTTLRQAIAKAQSIRWRGDAAKMQDALNDIDFDRLLSFSPPTGAHAADETAAAAMKGRSDAAGRGGLQICVLAEGDSPQLPPILETARALAMPMSVVMTSKTGASLGGRLAALKARATSVIVEPDWTVGAVAAHLLGQGAEVMAICEPGVSVARAFFDSAQRMLADPHDARLLIPEGLLMANNTYWDFRNQKDIIAPSADAFTVLAGGAMSLGCVAIRAATLKALLALRPSALSAPGSLLPCLLGSLGLQTQQLATVPETLAINHYGRLPSRTDWRLLLPQRSLRAAEMVGLG